MKKIPTLIAIIVLVIGIGLGIIGVQSARTFRLGASPDAAPTDVRITNITANSFTVSWVTDKKVLGFAKVGRSATVLDQTINGTDSDLKNLNLLNVTGLTPQTTYFLKINSDGVDFDNNGIPWQITTAPALGSSPTNKIVAGTVLLANGQPASKVLIHLSSGGLSPLSTLTSTNGSWVIALNSARNNTLDSYFDFTNPKTLLTVFVQGGSQGISSASIYLEAANQIPTMNLGQTYDFKSQAVSQSSDSLPEVSLDVPPSATDSPSKFQVDSKASLAPQSTVTLDSVKNNEVVTTTTPEFFGKGPAKTEITILVESTNPMTDQVTTDAGGEWNWSPPENLEPGNHTVTLKWTDAGGILRSIVRSFTVEAKEGPAFESTPSATLKPSPTPRVSIPATDTPIPVTGSLTPTIVIFMLGVGFLTASFAIVKKLESIN